MKKKVLALVLSCTMALSMGGFMSTTASAEESYKIGWSLISTSDPVVAKSVSDARDTAESYGYEFESSDANNDASKQIDAVENLIESGCDCIVIQAIDATSMSDLAARAMEKGIKVIAYGIGLDNYDVWYKNDNTVTGTAIGTMAADWINENLDGEAKVCVIGFSMIEVLVERADAIKAALEEQCPNVEIVAEFDAIDTETGMSNTETMLMRNPDVNVICSISDGSAVGAYEAVKTAGLDTDEFGIFGSDLSIVALKYIQDGTCYRGTTDCDNTVSGQTVVEIAHSLLTGEEIDDVVTMNVVPVTAENVADYAEFMEQ